MENKVVLSIIFFITGAIITIYLPLVVMYFIRFFRKTTFGFGMVWRFLLRLVLVAIVYVLVVGIMGIILGLVLPDIEPTGELPDSFSELPIEAFSTGMILGFAGGVFLFILGLIRGRRKKAATSA